MVVERKEGKIPEPAVSKRRVASKAGLENGAVRGGAVVALVKAGEGSCNHEAGSPGDKYTDHWGARVSGGERAPTPGPRGGRGFSGGEGGGGQGSRGPRPRPREQGAAPLPRGGGLAGGSGGGEPGGGPQAPPTQPLGPAPRGAGPRGPRRRRQRRPTARGAWARPLRLGGGPECGPRAVGWRPLPGGGQRRRVRVPGLAACAARRAWA